MDNEETRYVEVAVAAPLDQTLTYRLPVSLQGKQSQQVIGTRVLVWLQRRKLTGYILSFQEKPEGIRVKEIIEILDDFPMIRPEMISLYRWLAGYYHYPIGQVLQTALPGGLTRKSTKVLKLQAAPEQLFLGTGEAAPKWLFSLASKGYLSASQTKKLMADPVDVEIKRLLDEQLVVFEESVNTDAVRQKQEHWYELQLPLPVLVEGDCRNLSAYRALVKQLAGAGMAGLRPLEAGMLALLSERSRRGEPLSLTEARVHFPTAVALLRGLKEKGLVACREERVFRQPESLDLPVSGKRTLTGEQSEVLQKLGNSLELGGYHPYLLHGVTGSGKTEVYLQAAESALARGRGVLVLVPEIALTGQLESQFVARFGERVMVYHSGLTPTQRYDQYCRALFGQAKVVVGARSAIFAPLADHGLIIVDEEHETAYKQDDGLRYHARDLALVLGKMQKATVLLGSATPSLTSYYNAKSGKYGLLNMAHRVGEAKLPDVSVVNLAKGLGRGKHEIVSPQLMAAMQECLAQKHQAILLLNRRGFSAALICRDCGTPVECTHCHVSLTVHRGRGQLVCHYCGYAMAEKTLCANCQSMDLYPAGFGTERLMDEITQLFPDARCERIDSDTAADRKELKRVLGAMHTRQIDILVGTQMIAKGHHFPHVSLVGVIWADGGMSLPDFRASERTYQLITQVIGRAGRELVPGKVLLQTMRPEHYAIRLACQHDYQGLVEQELQLRSDPPFPPFIRLVLLRLQGRVESEVRRGLEMLARFIRAWAAENKAAVQVLGPAPSPLDKLKDNYRWQVLLKSRDTTTLNRVCRLVKEHSRDTLPRSCSLAIDVDPENMM